MRLEVRVKKEGPFWLIEVPALDVMTQGRTEREARGMLEDAVRLLVNRRGFKPRIQPAGKGSELYLTANDSNVVLALMLRRQRQKFGLTLKEVARRMGSTSANSFARYEQGKARPTVSKLLELISAINPDFEPVLKISP